MKSIAKAQADGMCLVLVAPALLLYVLGSRASGPERALPWWSQAFALVPGWTGVYLRRAFYRGVLRKCGPGSCLSFGSVISHPTAEIGRDVYVGLFCVIGAVTLEEDVLVSSHVSIINGGAQHCIARLDIPIREQPGTWTRVTIGRDTWIGERATVMADVGRHCVIGAGSIVTRPIPDYAIAVGCPARVIRYRDDRAEHSQEAIQSAVSDPSKADCP